MSWVAWVTSQWRWRITATATERGQRRSWLAGGNAARAVLPWRFSCYKVATSSVVCSRCRAVQRVFYFARLAVLCREMWQEEERTSKEEVRGEGTVVGAGVFRNGYKMRN